MSSLIFLLLTCCVPLTLGLYAKPSPVKVLKAAAFHDEVKNGDGLKIWLVEFFAPWCGHCKSFAPEYERVAKALDGIVKVAAVEDKDVMASEGVQGLPTIKLYLGEEIVLFRQERTADNVINFVLKELEALARKRFNKGSSASDKKSKKSSATSDVIEITDDNFQKTVISDDRSVWFLEFYAPWCGHCKALAPIWEQVAGTLKGRVKIAKIDATVSTSVAAQFGIKGYPTLILLPSGQKSVRSGVRYNGPREADTLVEFAMGFAGDSAKAVQLLNDAQFKDECSKDVCIVSFLPHLLDSGAKGRKSYLKQLNEAVKASVSMPVKFFWLQGGDNFELEEALRLQFGYPAVIATRIDKAKFAIHKGDFSSDSIRSFLTGLMSGRQTLSAIPDNLPAFATTSEWDGKDAPKEVPASDEM